MPGGISCSFSIHDNRFTRLQTFLNNPLVVLRHADLHIACAELAVLVQNGHGIALLGACHGLLGQSDHVISLGGFHADAHVQTRQQQSFGVGHFCKALRSLRESAADWVKFT